ncbi:MAG: hypothetical protein ACYTG6_17105, partial [Planctomycetota bacterium]
MTSPPPRPLTGLLGAQFLATFNDNALRMVVVLLLLGRAATEQTQQSVATSAFVAYNVPWILLSLPAGVLADRLSKRNVILRLRIFEIGLMLLVTWALIDGSAWALLG